MSIGRDDYQERRDERAERMEARADKARAESSAAFHTAQEISSCIPFGQPILVGHHSEKRHRRDLEKIDQNMRKSVEASEKADYYERRAETARNNRAISSDDPDAVEKLEAKLAAMQAAQERDKARNAWYRKHKTMKGCPGVTDEDAAKADAELLTMREAIRRPVPAWVFSNRNGEMKRIRDRLAQLRRVDEMEHTEIDFDGGSIITNEDVNRVQILFDAKPDEETRANLKRNGFKWSPKEGAWQTLRTPANLRTACRLFGVEVPKSEPAPEDAQPEERDDWEDIDPEEVKRRLHDNPEDSPFVRQVMDDVERMAAEEEAPAAPDGQVLFPLD